MAVHVQKGKLKPEDEYKVTANYAYLMEEIDAKYLTSFLFSKQVITLSDKDEIEETKRRDKRNKLLLGMILNSGRGPSFEIFIESLKMNYCHVVETLQNTRPQGLPPVPTPYAWFQDVNKTIKDHVINDSDASRIATKIGSDWELFMLRLGLSQIEIQREISSSNNDTLRITHLLIKWRHKVVREATIQRLMSCLMELEDSQSLTIDWEGLKRIVETIEIA